MTVLLELFETPFRSCCEGHFQTAVSSFWSCSGQSFLSCWDVLLELVVTVIFKLPGRLFGDVVTGIFELPGLPFGAVVTVIFEPLLFGAAMICQGSRQEKVEV